MNMKKKYINSDLVKLWSVLLTGIMLLLFVSSEWGTVKIILACSIGGVVTFYLTMLLLILLLGVIGIEIVDKRQYDEWKHQRLKAKTPRVFSYALYGWILTLAALGCGFSFTSYHQGLGGVLFEWIAYAALGFLGAQIIMRIIFLTWDISTDKGYIESMAHEIERQKAEKKELKKQRKAERRKRNSWISRAFFRGLGFGAGWSIFNPGDNNKGL